MSGDRFDYSSERQRHEKFVGRAGLLVRLDQLLVDDEPDRWVVITGGPGMGKSALLAAWLARREAAGALVPHHFIRRGAYNWDDPAKLVGSLVAQIEDRFPGLLEPAGDERMHPATRLSRALSRVSETVLRPRGERLVVLIDGLDEYDPPVGIAVSDPLAAFLPDALPPRVRLLCACRPRHPYVSSLETRDAELVQIDLDAEDNAAENDATVRAFWQGAARTLGLDAGFVEEAVARAGGNVQHAVQLRKQLAVLPPEHRRVADIPRGLAALIEKSWERIAVDAVVVDGLGILCAAREALTLDELGTVANWTGGMQRRTFLRASKELLVEALRAGGQSEYRLHHDSIRGHIACMIGDVALRAHHRALARRHATWPAPGQGAARRYALRHGLVHRAEACEWAEAWQLAADMSYLEAKCRELGVHETEADLARVTERCRASNDAELSRRFSDLARALVRESRWLRDAPEATPALMWNRLCRFGWSANDLDGQLRIPLGASFLHVRHVGTRESPALVRDLIGHSGRVTACAVTADGRRVISGSSDRTLRVWDLQSGRVLATLEGHTDCVTACAVTADGQYMVSASDDRTLKAWDLQSGRLIATLEGHTRMVAGCAIIPNGGRVVSASADGTLRVWDLESGRLIATLEGHPNWPNALGVVACAVTADGRRVVGALGVGILKVWDLESWELLVVFDRYAGTMMACAVMPDGRRAISASADKTLKVWDLDSRHVLATLEGHTGAVTACAVMADSRRIVSASEDRTLRVWDLESGCALAVLEGHSAMVKACAVTMDSKYVVSASADQTLKIWDLEGECSVATLEGHGGWVTACAMTANGQRVISTSSDGTLKVWDRESGRSLATLKGHSDWVMSCAVTADGRCVVSVSDDGTVRVCDLDESGRQVASRERRSDWATACAVTPDGRRAIWASDRTLKLLDVERLRVLAILEGHIERMTSCAMTMDGQRAVSTSSDGMLKVWDLERGRAIFTLRTRSSWVNACAVTLAGFRVIWASEDGTLNVWDPRGGYAPTILEGHNGWVNACAVTADGRHVVSASEDRTLKVWDLETHGCILTHRGDAPYSAVAISGTAIVAGDRAGALWFLDWPPETRRANSHHAAGSANRHRKSRPTRAISLPRHSMKKHTILFLAANPIGTDRLALDEEARAIQVELERSGHRDQFELVTRWAAQPLDLLRELRKLKPMVVHFSGHGVHGEPDTPRPNGSPRRDIVLQPGSPDDKPQHGLFFQGADGRPQLVSTAALEETFGAAGSSVKLVVLNACYSEVQAEALLAHVGCVVGMGGSISDVAARHFAIGFYGGLGERESVAAAYKQGRAAISLEGLRDSDRPQLKVRDGIDASQLVLATDPS